MVKVCEYCGNTFKSKGTKYKCCSRQCADMLSRRRGEIAFIKSLRDKDSDYEYVEGYTNNISSVTLRCTRCGEIVKKNASFLRKKSEETHDCCVAKKKQIEALIKAIKREQRVKEKVVQRKKEPITKQCIECGKNFITTRSRQVCCSSACSNKRNNRLKDINRRYKLRENGKVDYSISLHRLIKIHNGICALCGGKVNIKADINSDEYPSIDHVLPVAKGGTHTWDNVQLAHRRCNTIKSDSLMVKEPNGQILLRL